MIIPHYICLTVIVISGFGLWGCVYDGIQENSQIEYSEQLQEDQVSDASVVPQTLEPSSKSPPTESSSLEGLPSETIQQVSIKTTISPAQSETVTAKLTDPEATRNTSPKKIGKMFGEFVGVKTKWEEMKQQLVNQMQEQTRKTEELKVKLQLIEQIAEHVNFTTKAYITDTNVFLAEFTIENRTPYAIKDIAISCDQIAPTGTIIQSHAETIYAIIKPTTRSTYTPIPFGTKHRQTQLLQCQIVNFTVHNSSSS